MPPRFTTEHLATRSQTWGPSGPYMPKVDATTTRLQGHHYLLISLGVLFMLCVMLGMLRFCDKRSIKRHGENNSDQERQENNIPAPSSRLPWRRRKESPPHYSQDTVIGLQSPSRTYNGHKTSINDEEVVGIPYAHGTQSLRSQLNTAGFDNSYNNPELISSYTRSSGLGTNPPPYTPFSSHSITPPMRPPFGAHPFTPRLGLSSAGSREA